MHIYHTYHIVKRFPGRMKEMVILCLAHVRFWALHVSTGRTSRWDFPEAQALGESLGLCLLAGGSPQFAGEDIAVWERGEEGSSPEVA
jgi:hypothetical protein